MAFMSLSDGAAPNCVMLCEHRIELVSLSNTKKVTSNWHCSLCNSREILKKQNLFRSFCF